MNIEWTLALRWVSQLPSLPFLSLRLLLQDCKLQLKTTVVFGAPDTTWHIYNLGVQLSTLSEQFVKQCCTMLFWPSSQNTPANADQVLTTSVLTGITV